MSSSMEGFGWLDSGMLRSAPQPKRLDPAALKRPIAETAFAFLDTETTGISAAQGARVCELAILVVKDGCPVESFSSLVNPECAIALDAQRIHGITDEMVALSPTFGELAGKVRQLLEATALVCHNAPFDVSFLHAEFRRTGSSMPQVPIVDTLELARRHFKFERNNLGAIARSLGISSEGWHRAGNDVQLLRQIFSRFLESLASKGVRTLGDLLKL